MSIEVLYLPKNFIPPPKKQMSGYAPETRLIFPVLLSIMVAMCSTSHVCHGVIVGPIGSKLSDRFGCRAVTMTGGFLLCIGFVLCSLATKLFHVYLTFGVIGGMKICIEHSHILTWTCALNVVLLSLVLRSRFCMASYSAQ